MKDEATVILLVHPTAELYGSDRVFLESVSALVLAGHRVVVSLAARGPLAGELKARGVEVMVCPSPVLRKSLLTPRGFVKAIGEAYLGLKQGSRLIRELRPELIYVNTITIPLWNVLARIHRIPLIVHVHEGEASTGSIIRMALAMPLFLATTTIANSHFSAGVVEGSFKSLGRRIKVVHNAVAGPSEPPAPRAKLVDPVRLVYIGRLSPRKGVDIAIDSLALLNDRGLNVELDIVGDVFPGYEWYEQQLREQVESRGLSDKVRFQGFQPQIWGFLAASDIVVVPSRADEPFGNTAVEAILGGRPVIASETTGLIEATAGYGAASRVKANDPGELAAAVRHVVANWQDLKDALPKDLQTARQRHGLPAYQQRITMIVAEVLSPAGRVPMNSESRM